MMLRGCEIASCLTPNNVTPSLGPSLCHTILRSNIKHQSQIYRLLPSKYRTRICQILCGLYIFHEAFTMDIKGKILMKNCLEYSNIRHYDMAFYRFRQKGYYISCFFIIIQESFSLLYFH
jgi:hypothetical protein